MVEEVLEMMDLDRLMAALAQHMRNNRMTRSGAELTNSESLWHYSITPWPPLFMRIWQHSRRPPLAQGGGVCLLPGPEEGEGPGRHQHPPQEGAL